MRVPSHIYGPYVSRTIKCSSHASLRRHLIIIVLCKSRAQHSILKQQEIITKKIIYKERWKNMQHKPGTIYTEKKNKRLVLIISIIIIIIVIKILSRRIINSSSSWSHHIHILFLRSHPRCPLKCNTPWRSIHHRRARTLRHSTYINLSMRVCVCTSVAFTFRAMPRRCCIYSWVWLCCMEMMELHTAGAWSLIVHIVINFVHFLLLLLSLIPIRTKRDQDGELWSTYLTGYGWCGFRTNYRKVFVVIFVNIFCWMRSQQNICNYDVIKENIF